MSIRKRYLTLLAWFFASFSAWCPLSGQDPAFENLWTRKRGVDWPRMLGSQFDSTSPETGILKDWGPNGLRIVWTQKTGEGYGNGVVSQGRWFQFDRFGRMERLTCYVAETGKELWKWERPVVYADAYGYNNGPRSSPVVDGDRVYVYGVAGRLACIDVATGKALWELDVNEKYNVVQNFFGVASSPLIYRDLIWVMVGGSPESQRGMSTNYLPNAKPNDCAMVAFDKKTGREAYRVGNYLASYAAPVVQSINGVDYCLAFVREGLLTFRAADGSHKQFTPWRANMLESVNAASPVLVRGHVLVGEAYEKGGALLSVSDKPHTLLWNDSTRRREQLYRPHWTNPLVVGSQVYVSSGRNQPDTDLACLELAEKGSDRWHVSSKWSIPNRNRMTGLIVDQHMVLLGEDGVLQLVAIDSGQFKKVGDLDLGLKTDPTDNEPYILVPSWAPPVLSHGLLYVRGATKVICMELIPE
jgi:outer membrane protein assembly factor BamB